MAYDPDLHHRQSIRLRDFDYAGGGGYFVTLCVWQRECLFGDVVDGVARLNEWGGGGAGLLGRRSTTFPAC